MTAKKKMIFMILLGAFAALFLLACDNEQAPVVPDPPTYITLTYNAGEGGTIGNEPSQVQTILLGDTAKMVLAVPDEGYEFIIWSDGYRWPYRLDNYPQKDVNVTAYFKLREIEITYEVGGIGGYIVGNRKQTVIYGQDCSEVMAIPAEGYRFREWDDGLTDPVRHDTNVTVKYNYLAWFDRIIYTLTYRATEGGNVSCHNEIGKLLIDNTEAMLQKYEVIAIADENYRFVKWSDGNILNPRVFRNVKEDIDITAIFEPI